MSHIIEVNEDGSMYLSAEMLGNPKPHTRYLGQGYGGNLTLTRIEEGQEPPFWAIATPEERARAFWEWATSHDRPEGPALPDEALGRDSSYD